MVENRAHTSPVAKGASCHHRINTWCQSESGPPTRGRNYTHTGLPPRPIDRGARHGASYWTCLASSPAALSASGRRGWIGEHRPTPPADRHISSDGAGSPEQAAAPRCPTVHTDSHGPALLTSRWVWCRLADTFLEYQAETARTAAVAESDGAETGRRGRLAGTLLSGRWAAAADPSRPYRSVPLGRRLPSRERPIISGRRRAVPAGRARARRRPPCAAQGRPSGPRRSADKEPSLWRPPRLGPPAPLGAAAADR